MHDSQRRAARWRWVGSCRFARGLICLAIALSIAPAVNAQIQWRSAPHQINPVLSPSDTTDLIHQIVGERDRRHLVIQCRQTLTREQCSSLENAGVIVLDALGDGAYFACVDATQIKPDVLRSFAPLKFVMPIERPMKLHPSLAAGNIESWAIIDATHKNPDGNDDPIVVVYVQFHRDVSLEQTLPELNRFQVRLISRLRSINALVIQLPYSQIAALADDDLVKWIEPPLPGLGPTNDSARVDLQVHYLQDPPFNLDGSGVSVMVYDDGMALASHMDFGGRLTTRDDSLFSSHSTHVSGTLGGSGAASAGQFAGMAPAVTIEQYGMQQPGGSQPGFLFFDPADLENDYTDAINIHGVVLANNSLGSNVASNGFPCEWTGDYGLTSSIIDGIIRGSLGDNMRIIWAGGNERAVANCGQLYFTTAPPAGAKNHITVGAINSDDNSVTSFTSWGPVDDGRLKPDICGPGCELGGDTGVTSTSGFNPDEYITMCGTSMAAPAITGIVALMLQDFRANNPTDPDPLNASIKALLIHNALDLTNPGPDYQTGYGLVQAKKTVEFQRTENFLEDSISHGQTINYAVNVAPGEAQLKVTIVWDDVPATPNVINALVNDLDLIVSGPGGTIFPFTLDPLDPAAVAVQTQADHLNNVEQVLVNNPAPGIWQVQVTGFSVPQGPQTFSLAASPDLVRTTISFPNGVPTLLAPGLTMPLSVDIDSRGETVVAGSAQLVYRIDNGSFIASDLASVGGSMYFAQLPAMACGSTLDFFISIVASITGSVFSPALSPVELFTADVGVVIDVFDDNFEQDLGWTIVNSGGLLDGAWQRGIPSDGNRGDPAVDADGSGQCFITDNNNFPSNNSDVDNGSTTLVSPIMDATIGDPVISYYRWFSNDFGNNPFEDTFVVEISDDGGTIWQVLETVGPAGVEASGSWFFKSFPLGDIPGFLLTNQFRIRFTAEDQFLPSIVEAGVDGVKLTSSDCIDPVAPGDVTGDGLINVDDLLILLAAWGICPLAEPPAIAPDCPADLDSDGTVNVIDLLTLLGNWTMIGPS